MENGLICGLEGVYWCGEGCIPVKNAMMLLAAFAKKFHMDAARYSGWAGGAARMVR